MSDTMPQSNANPVDEDLEIDVQAVTARLDKHMQRLPWKASKLQPLPSDLHDFATNWLVPILNDLYMLTTASITMQGEVEDTARTLFAISQQSLGAVQATLQGESVALLHLQFKRLHSTLVNKLAPTDPASFALMEMHDIFVRLGMEAPFDTDEAESATAEASSTPTEASNTNPAQTT